MATGQHPQGEPSYDADAKAAARLNRTYRIGERVFVPVKKTGRVMRKVMELQPDRPDDDESKQASFEFLDSLYQQLAVLLRPQAPATESGEAPLYQPREDPEIAATAEHFQEHLDLEEGRELLRLLLPREEAAAGNTGAGASQPEVAR